MFWRQKDDRPEYDPAVALDVESWRLPVEPEPPIELEHPTWPQPVASEPEPSILEQDWQGNVVLFTDDGDIALRVTSVPEAKLAIKQLRLRKKAVGLEKREVTHAITAINTQRRMQTANQGSKMRGGGDVGKIVRSFQTLGRDADRRNHAARLQPYQQEKARLDQYTLTIDQLITQLEAYILQNSD